MEQTNNQNTQKRVVAARLLIPMEFPAEWTDGDIWFYLRNGYCASNLLNVLNEMTNGGEKCICNYCNLEVVDDAMKAKILEEFEFEPPIFSEIEGKTE